MNKDVRLSFNSYDRFFQNQDTLTEGKLGNLVDLPLQGKALIQSCFDGND
jgi:hypothetical protein